MIRTSYESTEEFLRLLRERQFDVARYHEVSAKSDLFSLLEAEFGVGFLPVSTKSPESLKRTVVTDMDLERTVYLYGVAGRQRTAVAGAVMKMLRAFDWSQAVAA